MFILGHPTICPICIESALRKHLCCILRHLWCISYIFLLQLEIEAEKAWSSHLVDAYEMCIQMDLFMDNKQQERSWKQDITVQGTVEFLSIPHSDIVRKPGSVRKWAVRWDILHRYSSQKRRPSSRPGAPLFRQCQGLTSAPGQYAEVGNSSARLVKHISIKRKWYMTSSIKLCNVFTVHVYKYH